MRIILYHPDMGFSKIGNSGITQILTEYTDINKERERERDSYTNIQPYDINRSTLVICGDPRKSRAASWSSPRRSPRHQRCARSGGQAKRRARGRSSSEVRSWWRGHGSLAENHGKYREKKGKNMERYGKMRCKTSQKGS